MRSAVFVLCGGLLACQPDLGFHVSGVHDAGRERTVLDAGHEDQVADAGEGDHDAGMDASVMRDGGTDAGPPVPAACGGYTTLLECFSTCAALANYGADAQYLRGFDDPADVDGFTVILGTPEVSDGVYLLPEAAEGWTINNMIYGPTTTAPAIACADVLLTRSDARGNHLAFGIRRIAGGPLLALSLSTDQARLVILDGETNPIVGDETVRFTAGEQRVRLLFAQTGTEIYAEVLFDEGPPQVLRAPYASPMVDQRVYLETSETDHPVRVDLLALSVLDESLAEAVASWR